MLLRSFAVVLVVVARTSVAAGTVVRTSGAARAARGTDRGVEAAASASWDLAARLAILAVSVLAIRGQQVRQPMLDRLRRP